MRRWGSSETRRSAASVGRAAVLFLATSIAAAPAGRAGEYTILGAGSRPCGSWLQARGQATPESTVMQSWLLGYITSINAHELTITKDISEGTNPEGMFVWVDTYCSTHPLDSVARAAASLSGVLRSSTQAH